ncbi:NUDIX domain-containing protein [Algibacter amylolyticus]|uniref:NUDIX domain-containing protein n=1 Tax=Algibacter amylolyticus TaxID=1608400 RepID=A0A5M7B2C9_9FLAO|nr:NUDIX domain-containing protein [Algibacter amylolyticus]KAA5823612.1 NUDIX domain-containing protein [Algibacter amylolyticus]MBB5267771.1 isopentenyldiphosphate isomerase [Algibacter amylolyticus]TSJ74100.1 NUDIX domain-containing protein [Algibacter amylolyticus]
MDEYLDIVDAHRKPTGKTELKSVIHAKGYYHNTAHIWFYTKDCKILLSQRSAKKNICPLLWDVSVAGHIDAGETIESGAIREVEEEIGLSISEKALHKIGVFECFQSYDNGIIDNEFHNTFIAELNVPLEKLVKQEEEVEALKLVSFEAFKTLIATIGHNNNHFVPSNKAYYDLVLKAITKQIK